MTPRLALALPVAMASLALGVVVGTAATLVHGLRVGLVLALVASIAAVLALPPGWWSRLPFALGWLGVVLYLSNPRPEGDYLVASDLDGYLLLGSGLVLVAFSIITVRPLRPRRSPPASAGDVGNVGAVADPS